VDGIGAILIGFSRIVWLKPKATMFFYPPAKAGGNSKTLIT
jgi:hypothetical protein